MTNKKRDKEYFIADKKKVYVVKGEFVDVDGEEVEKKEFFDEISSRQEALGIGCQIKSEIFRTLKGDVDEGDSYIHNMKVVTGLERSLVELDNKYPFLLMQISSIMSNNKC